MRMSVSSGRGNFAAPFALLHRVVQPFAPVAGFALGVGDGVDDDVIVFLIVVVVPLCGGFGLGLWMEYESHQAYFDISLRKTSSPSTNLTVPSRTS